MSSSTETDVASERASAARFFIALLPPVAIQNYAQQVIRELSDQYHTATAKAPPHVTLQPPFLWQVPSVSALEICLQTFAITQLPVPVSLSSFGAFAPRVLYINVLKTPELLALQAALMAKLEAQLGIVDPASKRRPFSPHLTVASRNVTRPVFKQAWAELQSRSVELEFVADRLTLLIHDGQRWQMHREFNLGS